jgi:L-ribulose-5-phosphate 3-epimerase
VDSLFRDAGGHQVLPYEMGQIVNLPARRSKTRATFPALHGGQWEHLHVWEQRHETDKCTPKLQQCEYRLSLITSLLQPGCRPMIWMANAWVHHRKRHGSKGWTEKRIYDIFRSDVHEREFGRINVLVPQVWRRTGRGCTLVHRDDDRPLCRAGISGIEIIGNHLDDMGRTSPGDIHALKQYLAMRGMAPVSVSAHHNFVQPDPAMREAELNKLIRWVDVAAMLGAPFVRAFGGRWGTLNVFAEFMAANGEEPPLEGYSVDDAYGWTVECFRMAAWYAGRKGVTLGLENHWGLTGTAEGTLRISNAFSSPWLKLVLDTGNFIHAPDMYDEMSKMLPHVALVHAKTYTGGSIYFGDFAVDYDRVAQMLDEAGYLGYVSIEFEGRAMPDEGITSSVRELNRSFHIKTPYAT